MTHTPPMPASFLFFDFDERGTATAPFPTNLEGRSAHRFNHSHPGQVKDFAKDFGSVVYYTKEQPYGWAMMVRVSGAVDAEAMNSDGTLRFSQLVAGLVQGGFDVRALLPWPGMNHENDSLSLYPPGLHEIPSGSTRSFYLAIIIHPELFDGAEALNERLEPSLATEHSLFRTDGELFEDKMGPFPVSELQKQKNALYVGVGAGPTQTHLRPIGQRGGAEAGGDGIEFTPWEGLTGEEAANHVCLIKALRTEQREFNVAIDGNTGYPFNPHTLGKTMEWDAGAGTGLNSRLPHLNRATHEVYNNNGSSQTEENREYRKSWHSHNDGHWSRSIVGLIGLAEWLGEDHELGLWATEMLLARASFLWLELPDVESKGKDLLDLIAGSGAPGGKAWWDRDEGWTLYAATVAKHYVGVGHFGLEMVDRLNSWFESWCEAFIAARLPNGMMQDVRKGQGSWSSNPRLMNAAGQQLADNEGATLTFQEAIILTAGKLASESHRNSAMSFEMEMTAADGAGWLGLQSLPSTHAEHNGGKVGPPNIVAVTRDGEPIMNPPYNAWGNGDVVNCLAMFGRTGHLNHFAKALGSAVSTLDEAWAVVIKDERNGNSAGLAWSAMGMQAWNDSPGQSTLPPWEQVPGIPATPEPEEEEDDEPTELEECHAMMTEYYIVAQEERAKNAGLESQIVRLKRERAGMRSAKKRTDATIENIIELLTTL